MKNRNLELLAAFMKIGATTFGGGYAMLPMIQREVVDKRKWMTTDEMLDIIAVSESTPGPFAINCATFVGYSAGGISGAFFATLGSVIPSFLIIILLSGFLMRYRDNRILEAMMQGIRAGVVLLLFLAAGKLAGGLEKSLFTLSVLLASFLVIAFTGVNVIIVLAAGAAMGLMRHLYENGKEKRR